MKLHYRNDHIVRFKNGDLWHFFSQKGKGIYFRYMKKSGNWGNETELVANTHEYFSMSIDSHDHLHLIYQDHNGEIVYMEYNGNTWNKQLLHQYDTSSYIVQFPTIIVLNEQVHVIFAVGTIPSTGVWSLYHCYNNGNGWIKGEITRYEDGRQTSPFYLDYDQRSIHMIYRSMYRNQHRLFYCYFDGARNRWSRPESLSRNLIDCNMPSMLVKNNKLHLAWTSIKNSNLQVMYRNWHLNSYFKTGLEREALLSSEESNCSDPQLFWADNQLWCMWYQNDDIYCCSSPDEGMTWNQAKSLEWSHIDSCYCIKYSSNYPEDQSNFKVHRIFANLENGLEIPILGECKGLSEAIHAVKIEDLPSKPTMDQPHFEHPEPSQQVNAPSAPLKQNSAASDPPASQDTPYSLSEKAAHEDTSPTSPTSNQEIYDLKPADSGHACENVHSTNANSSSHDAALHATGYVADKKQSTPQPNTQQPETELKEAPIESGNIRQEHHHPYEKTGQLPADQIIPDNVVNHVLALIQEMNKVHGLRARFQALLDKNQPEQDSTHYLFQLDALLNSWIKKAEGIQAQNQTIMREIEALRRRSIENQRQWEILLEEFEEIKNLLEKNLRRGFLRKIIG